MPNWPLYELLAQHKGDTRRERVITEARSRIENVSADHPSYQECLVDGTNKINLLVMGSEELNTKKIKVMPSDAEYMHYGALVQWDDGYWLVTDLDFDDTVTKNGYMKYCNVLLRFQLGTDPTVYERYGVFDPGVYSTTTKETNTIPELNWQYKIFLPFDEKTAELYVDKRIAIGTMPSKDGTVLECYKLTQRDITSQSIGDDCVLIMYCKSDPYDPSSDNLEECICNYISPTFPVPPNTSEELNAKIIYSGNSTVRIGGSGKTYQCVFTDSTGEIIEGVNVEWSLSDVSSDIYIQSQDNDKCRIVASENTDDGTLFMLRVHGTKEGYEATCSVAVEAMV